MWCLVRIGEKYFRKMIPKKNFLLPTHFRVILNKYSSTFWWKYNHLNLILACNFISYIFFGGHWPFFLFFAASDAANDDEAAAVNMYPLLLKLLRLLYNIWRVPGFEPEILRPQTWCATNELHSPLTTSFHFCPFGFSVLLNRRTMVYFLTKLPPSCRGGERWGGGQSGGRGSGGRGSGGGGVTTQDHSVWLLSNWSSPAVPPILS